MAYPTLEQYNEALQSPQLVLQDAELKYGTLKTTGLGLPLALCGGFALTYTVQAGGKKFALRCFHKESRELERRYQAISARIKQLASPYFLPFEFIPAGIRIQGVMYPIVKMAWAQGQTLAEFLENEYRNPQSLQKLRQALTDLADFLEKNQISHGDIQPENIMVSAGGSTIQLIDYDGMYVEALQSSKATELGQVNFQHPKRTANDFNEKLDRFSFLTLDVALQALIASSSIWTISRSEPSAVVFRRNDFLDPGSSVIFKEALKITGVGLHVKNLARVALGDFNKVPTLVDFLQNKGIYHEEIIFGQGATLAKAGYQGAYVVCDALKYEKVFEQVGSRIELIGKIHSVRRGWGANRKPYVFVNFSDWRGKAVKLAIWSDGMNAIGANVPDQTWVGRWLSVTGLVDAPYHGHAKSTTYTHISITITAPGQIQQIPEQEARYRLLGGIAAPAKANVSNQNANILSTMTKGTGAPTSPIQITRTPSAPQKSSNQQLLEKMRAQQVPQVTYTSAPPVHLSSNMGNSARSNPVGTNRKSSGLGWGGWLFIIVVGFMLLRGCAS
ncbi:protein kinase family protein [Aeromonas dhakensis]|uniref:protein kinase family protein n=1 Tax=Aeromonas dhakensis TaxID=196024 RepID=UPI00111959CD|nr:protein kinase family protein [Aeromonas dhakensis]TNI49350.1 serine/threonine protein kinase [Aeromonas dhakensis]